jgi:hypothetical protein
VETPRCGDRAVDKIRILRISLELTTPDPRTNRVSVCKTKEFFSQDYFLVSGNIFALSAA